MAMLPDGQTIVNTSETTNMAHFIDTATREIVANVLVDARPLLPSFLYLPDSSPCFLPRLSE